MSNLGPNYMKISRGDVIEYIFSVADYILVKDVGGELVKTKKRQ